VGWLLPGGLGGSSPSGAERVTEGPAQDPDPVAAPGIMVEPSPRRFTFRPGYAIIPTGGAY